MSDVSETEISQVMELLEGFQTTCLVVAAVKLGLFESLNSGPRSVADVARGLAACPDSLSRLCRGLVAMGLLKMENEELRLTGRGKALVKGRSFLPTWALMIRQEFLPAWSSLDQAVLTGKPSFDAHFGMDVWEHRRRRPDLARAFNQSMTAIQQSLLNAFLSCYSLPEPVRIVDVGGGCGTWLSGLLAAYPESTGVLFDQEHVVRQAQESSDSKLELVGGSFFKAVPPGDVLILKSVLHNWNDHDGIAILKRCKEALSEKGKLLVIESPLEETAQETDARLVMFDLHMMAVLGGRERSRAQYEALGRKGGFRLVGVTELGLRGICVLEFSSES